MDRGLFKLRLMKDDCPFHLPPYSNAINLDVKLSIIQALAQNYSIQKTYYVQSFLNQFAKRRHSIQETLFMSFRIYSSTKLLNLDFYFKEKIINQLLRKILLKLKI